MSSKQNESSWPAHVPEVRPWRQSQRGGTYEDRKLTEVVTMRPPLIAELEVPLTPAISVATEAGVREITALDHSRGAELKALETLLLRTESVASSRIERIEASVDDFARALHGSRSNASATAMVAAADALVAMINSVKAGGDIEVEHLLVAHQALMADDQYERAYAGRLRDMQNWIGGSDYSPRIAWFVPPAADRVATYLEDLLVFANRTDLPVLAQAAIVHAQFESIHPFTDGNGRIGRALINAVLRRRGATRQVVVPLASALVARRDEYFGLLTEYRAGRIEPLVLAFSTAATIAARESQVSARRIEEMPELWQMVVGARRASAVERLLDGLIATPVFSAEDAVRAVGGAPSSVYTAIERLHEAGVIRPLTRRVRNQVWGASDVLDEVEILGARIAAAFLERAAPEG
jgi:Fic family protein